jgi:hypothetical protein
MELSRIEWAQAQKLLVTLVQALNPPQNRIKQNFYLPPSRTDAAALKLHEIQLLQTLKLTQKQITEWVERLPEGKASIPQVQGMSPSHRLVEQVRVAIQNLSTHENLLNPKAAPLRVAFMRIKPLIDEMIEAVCRGDDSDDPARKKKRTWTRKKKEEKKEDV